MWSRWRFATIAPATLWIGCGSGSGTYAGVGAGQSGTCGQHPDCDAGAVQGGSGAGALDGGTSGGGASNAGGTGNTSGGGASNAGAAAGSGASGGSGGSGGTGSDAQGLDVLVLFDTSGSTCSDFAGELVACDSAGCGATTVPETTAPSRLDVMRAGLVAWLNQGASSAIRAGIGYFGHQCIGQTTCDPADHATPAVGIESLPNNAPAIESSLGAAMPTGETPTGPAIRGACQHAAAWQLRNGTRKVVILLITDGLPEASVSCGAGCCPTLGDAVTAAEECRSGQAGIPTYVVAVGSGLAELGQIAMAGGTALYTVGSENEMVQSLEAFRSDALAALQ